MADNSNEGTGADFDLSQFYQIFFEEAGENLDQMEQMLLNLDLSNANDEELNGIFRCAHSIKGGAATFGFSDVAELTHQMESLLDKLRRHEIQPIPAMVDVLLDSADASRSLLARHQAGGQGEALSTTELVQRIVELASGQSDAGGASVAQAAVFAMDELPTPTQEAAPAPAPQPAPAPAVTSAMPRAAAPGQMRTLHIQIGPMERLEHADAIKSLFQDIAGLGTIQDLPAKQPQTRLYEVQTASSEEDLLDLFAFHVAKEQVQIVVASEAEQPSSAEPGEPVAPNAGAYGFFPGAPGAPQEAGAGAATVVQAPAAGTRPAGGAARAGEAKAAQMESTTIRVAVNKVDQLINLVGELVITQAMLAQNSQGLDAAQYQQLLAGLADLDRNTRDLQESVMSIRMIPMATVFSRFPRMLRDVANKLGKKVELVTQGEATELDKGLVEKITDPLTHLVRNSVDHGIEAPADRLAAGKSEHGTITLSASHQGGSIVIEVRDDGKGMSREKILRKARERGMDVSDSMPDSEVWQLIFAPGFSTAEVVTDVSGRGVGMDVVKKNIAALNGSVEIDSAEGYGMRVAVRLPLTLAIMDGMSVGVGNEVYILPLSSVVESFQVNADDVSTVAQGSQLVKVRDEYMPVISLEKVFQVPRHGEDKTSTIMVVVESDGSRIALLVDELLGQHQVVVKNLETNYRKVANVSGATILGDGTVALILDTSSLVRRARY
jgi:two-component system chemotaxis sensor kinase CheA